jgi:PAS domain S-box-containing protein
MIGYTTEDIPNLDTWWQLAYPDEGYREYVIREWYAEIEASVRENRRFEPFLAHVRCKNGTFKYFLGSFTPLDNESLITFQDVTESKKAEDELREAIIKSTKSEARLVEAQRTTKVGSWETNLATLEVIWSEETYNIFELDYHAFTATHDSFLSFVHPDDKLIVDEAFKNSFHTSGYNVIEHRIVTSRGFVKYVEERWTIEYDKFGQPSRAVGTCQDISERKELEAKTNQVMADLIRRNRDLERFSYMVSHNLRAPVTNIISISDYIMNFEPTHQEIQALNDGLRKSVQKLDDVIQELNRILQNDQETGKA